MFNLIFFHLTDRHWKTGFSLITGLQLLPGMSVYIYSLTHSLIIN